MNVCIYGDGHVAHSLAAKIANYLPVTVLLRFNKHWCSRLTYSQAGILHETNCVINATADVRVVRDADLIFIALPQFAFEGAIDRICPYLHRGQIVAAAPAPAKMNEYSKRLEKVGVQVVGFQRAPYISRIVKYGEQVQISTDRNEHKCVVSDSAMKGTWQDFVTTWFGGRVFFLSSFSVFAFNNSNPLLHPSRMVVLFRDWQNKTYSYNPPFYAEWTDESSMLYLAADLEMREVMERCPEIDFEADYESVLDHYGVRDAEELTRKIRSISSFKAILSPMREENGAWVPDFGSRYFTEDIPFGTKAIQAWARHFGVDTPTIDYMVESVERMRLE